LLVVGAKGFAKEVLEILYLNKESKDLVFYDDVNNDVPTHLYNMFPILITKPQAEHYFKTVDNKFTIGLGEPKLRSKLYKDFTAIGGQYHSTISKNTQLGSFGIEINKGCNILPGVQISNDVTIGMGTLIYYNAIITHDVKIGQFCELSPGVILLGRCIIKDFVKIGAGAIVFPDVIIGSHTIIAAGSVVRADVPNNAMVAGVPAVVKKYI
jgi:sugar O-acyltransferase (sialic acid O-acetyltransferase NeuD family)